jgi:hypothetical protein
VLVWTLAGGQVDPVLSVALPAALTRISVLGSLLYIGDVSGTVHVHRLSFAA